VLIVATEWNQFRNLNLIKAKELMSDNILVDLRNVYDPEKVKELGFQYWGMGRR
jgi:UDPglucose 6-dehydrogenase